MSTSTRVAAFVAVLLLAVACATPLPLQLDPATTAAAGGDATLVHSACAEQLGHGYDLCRVTEGAEVVETWAFTFPWAPGFVDGDLNVEYLGQTHVFKITGPTLEVPWKLLTGGATWKQEDRAPAQARAAIKFKAPDGDHWVDLLGYAFPIVLKQGYAPLPLDSGRNFTELVCRLQYTSAGRSAVQCQP
jgi:hypothetical protein